jgi:hypothetical protein
MDRLKSLILLVMPVLFAGCSFYTAPVLTTDYYWINPSKSLSDVGNVVIVELDNNSKYPNVSTDMTNALFQATQKRQLFGVSAIKQTEPRWKSLLLNFDSTYTFEQLAAAKKTLNGDAILVGTITDYQPYPHLSIGLKLKLIDLNDGQLLWALEQIWDSADKTTEYQIKHFYSEQMRSGFAPLREQLLVISSLEFIRFVAFEVAGTLK